MPSTSILMLCMEGIQSLIQALDLTDIPDANVLIQQTPWDREQDLPASSPFPCILIAPWGGEVIDPNAGTNVNDDVVYPIGIWMLDKHDLVQTANTDRNLLWREKIRQKLHNRRNPSAPTVWRMAVQAKPIVDPGGWKQGKYISGLMALCTSREGRIA